MTLQLDTRTSFITQVVAQLQPSRKQVHLPPDWVIEKLLTDRLDSTPKLYDVDLDAAKINKIAKAIENSLVLEGTYQEILSEIWQVPMTPLGVSNIWDDIDVNEVGQSVLEKIGLKVISLDTTPTSPYENLYHWVFDEEYLTVTWCLGDVQAEF